MTEAHTGPVVHTGLAFHEVVGFRPVELDLYLPAACSPPPVVIYLHGGGWRRGSRRQLLPAVVAVEPDPFGRLARAGFAVAVADYRLSGEATHPAALEDVRAAIDWVRTGPCSAQLDGSRIVLWGESAGGHLALLGGLDPGPGRTAVAAVIAWFPVTDLVGLAEDVRAAGGEPDDGPGSRESLLIGAEVADRPDLARRASPTAYAHASAPPVLLLHGTDDVLVPAVQSSRLAAELGAAGSSVEVGLVKGAGHMWKGAADVEAILRRSEEFAAAHT